MALTMLTVAARPADEDHTYGHGKAEYFSSGVEGTLILLAAISIAVAAVRRLIHPQPLEAVGLGLCVSLSASVLKPVDRTAITPDSAETPLHYSGGPRPPPLTDVWTAGGVVAGVAVAGATGWNWMDAAIALVVAANIVRTGVSIVRRSISGLMDTALEPEDRRKVLQVLVPGQWTVQRGHELLERIERDVRKVVPHAVVFTHLESVDDPRSWDDATLDRQEKGLPVHAALGK